MDRKCRSRHRRLIQIVTFPLRGVAFAYLVVGFGAALIYGSLRLWDRMRILILAGRLYARSETPGPLDGYGDRVPYRRARPAAPPVDSPAADTASDFVFGYECLGYTSTPDILARDLDFYERLRHEVPLGVVLAETTRCIYCTAPLAAHWTAELRGEWRSEIWRYETIVCPSCGWWAVGHRRLHKQTYGDWYSRQHAYAVMRKYDPLALETPLELAREHLRRHPHKLARVDPFRFEDLIADCMRDYFGGADIVQIGGHRDNGVDMIAIHADGATTLIQVKRRGDFSKPEGVRVVRELHGVMLRDAIPRGLIVTTATRFTSGAHAEIARARTTKTLEHYAMDLMSLDGVKDLLDLRQMRHRDWASHGIRLTNPSPDWHDNESWVSRSALMPHFSRRIAQLQGPSPV